MGPRRAVKLAQPYFDYPFILCRRHDLRYGLIVVKRTDSDVTLDEKVDDYQRFGSS